MPFSSRRFIVATFLSLVGVHSAYAEPPKTLIAGWQLEQLAQAPDIVTPIGVAFDKQGRLLVIESHTHQRQEDYQGPESDRILAFSAGNDGCFKKPSVFAAGYRHAMSILADGQGGLYVVTRKNVHLLTDSDQDGIAEGKREICRIETEVDYPHNGLGGIALGKNAHGESILYLGMGENFGGDYKLTGSDGSMTQNSGGVGIIYSCRPDGSQLTKHAEGFWNPFGLCRAGERLFCVDNDPDASPPCRLIDVAPGADYGFSFEFGRAGIHPLQAWDGELPGTDSMLCGTGEAPTGIVFHRGWLWVTSWGDHCIERYKLKLKDGNLKLIEKSLSREPPTFVQLVSRSGRTALCILVIGSKKIMRFMETADSGD